jgi:FixJ family two-component response regulator
VDDDRLVRESLRALLGALDFSVATFSAPGSFQRFYRADMPGCLLLDIQMPRQSGLELYQQLLAEGKRLPVIFMTAHADIATAVAAMKRGAVEFLEKPFDSEALVDRVKQALALDALWRQRDASYVELTQRVSRLTARQRETLELIRTGATNKAIAAKLRLTERAVEMRRSSIMRKLQVRSLAELIDLTTTHRVLEDLRELSRRRMAP